MDSTFLPQTNIRYRKDETILDITTEANYFRFKINHSTGKKEVLLVDTTGEEAIEILLNDIEEVKKGLWTKALESLEASQKLLPPTIYQEIWSGLTRSESTLEAKR